MKTQFMKIKLHKVQSSSLLWNQVMLSKSEQKYEIVTEMSYSKFCLVVKYMHTSGNLM